MIEIVFGDSACGSLKVAQSYGKEGDHGAVVSVILRHEDGTEPTAEEVHEAQFRAEKEARLTWGDTIPLGGKSSDIYCFEMCIRDSP